MSLKLELEKVAEIRALVGEGDEELLHDMVEGSTDLFEIIDWMLDKEAKENAFQEAIASRINALTKRLQSSEGRQERLRSAILIAMEASGQKTLRRPEATLTIKEKPIGIQSIDESMLPEAFWVTKRSVSRTAINEALKDGNTVAGVLLNNGGVSLTVRRS